MSALLRHPWPGNVRELRNVMERACLLSTDTIDAAHLLLTPGAPLLPIASALPALSATPSIAPRSGPITTGRLRAADRQPLMHALPLHGGNHNRDQPARGTHAKHMQKKLNPD